MTLHIQLHRRHSYGVASVHRELGYGSAASVVSGAMSTGELVVEIALKVFPPNAETFKQEFAAMRALSHPFSHPYIIDFIGTSEMGPRDVIVLPLISKGSLDKYLKENPGADRVRLILQVGEALRFMHDDAGFVHGDIKCQNVLVDHNGDAQLADFGQTSRLRSPTSPGTEMPGGTLRFMAPELLLGDGRMSAASDVYAFGSLIYQAFTDNMPWQDLSDSGVIWAICSGKRPPRSKPIPKFFWKLSVRCWSWEPARRPRMRDIVPLIRARLGVALQAWRTRVHTKDNYEKWQSLDASVLWSLAKVAWGGWRIFSAPQAGHYRRPNDLGSGHNIPKDHDLLPEAVKAGSPREEQCRLPAQRHRMLGVGARRCPRRTTARSCAPTHNAFAVDQRGNAWLRQDPCTVVANAQH
ncbi:kinase-like protein [Auricularia subglabra TFB-10046 SS5]|nr:kinase-like protein [Auricularia subglabra TFB-10046 SS5]